MTFDWLSFFNVAEALAKGELANQTDGSFLEGCYRSSVSRAYYFAFQKAYEFLRDNENDPLILFHYSTYLQAARAFKEANEMRKLSIQNWDGSETELRLKIDKTEMHVYVRKSFLHKVNKDRNRIFNTLDDLRKLRNTADYDSARPLNLNHANEALDLARKTKVYLEELSSK